MMNEIIDQIFQQYSQYSNVDISLELIAVFFGHDYFGENGETFLTLLGAGIISYGHFRNQKLCGELSQMC